MSTRDFSWSKGGRCAWLTKVVMIRGLNLPGTPRATSACRGIPLLYLLVYPDSVTHVTCYVFDSRLVVTFTTVDFLMFVCPSVCNNSAPTERIFVKFYIFRKSVDKIQVSLKSDKNNGYFTWRYMYIYDCIRAWGSVVVKALRYYSDGTGIDSRWCRWGFFPWLRRNHVP